METKIRIPHLGILVTTFCNLNCRNCADLIPKRRNCHCEIETVKDDIKKVLEVVDYIDEVLVIGGETLLYPQLVEMLDFCKQQDKMGKLIITTNGSIKPDEKLLNCLERDEVCVRISGYPDYAVRNRKEVVDCYRKHRIEIEDLENMKWYSMGDTLRRGRSKEELKKVFGTCIMKDCVTLDTEGRIVYCSRQLSACETDIYPRPDKHEYVNVRNNKNLLEDLKRFYSLEYISTCDYCDGISCATTKYIPTAVQILDKKVFLELLGLYCEWKDCGEKIDRSFAAMMKMLYEQAECLYDVEQYAVLLYAFEAWGNNKTEENVCILRNAVLQLINALAEDYQYVVAKEVPYAKSNMTENIRNSIRVGILADEQADIIITEEELFNVTNEKYPIDGIAYNRLFLESKLEKLKTEQIECVVCGASYTQYGILEKAMPIPTVNISVTDQAIPYMVLMARKVLELNDKVEKIIIPMTYYQGFYDMSADDVLLHQEVMERINIPILEETGNDKERVELKAYRERNILGIYNHICDLKKVQEQRDRECIQALRDEEYFNVMNPRLLYGELKFDFLQLSEEEKYIWGQKTAELNERSCTKEGYLKTKLYLEEFLRDMKMAGKKVVFFVPPMTKYLYLAYHKELKESYYEKIVPIIQKYDNVKFVDLAQNTEFVNEDFCDFTNLSIAGAEKMTKILGKIYSQDETEF